MPCASTLMSSTRALRERPSKLSRNIEPSPHEVREIALERRQSWPVTTEPARLLPGLFFQSRRFVFSSSSFTSCSLSSLLGL